VATQTELGYTSRISHCRIQRRAGVQLVARE
jgi:hypothetical protein